MKALVYRTYGTPDVLQVEDLPVPSPAPDEVLIRVGASGLNPTDSAQRSGMFRMVMGNHFPKRVGMDVAGEVIQVGKNVTAFHLGDRVYGMTVDFKSAGTAAEYATMKATHLAKTPPTLDAAQAAAVPLAAQTALQALVDQGALASEQRILINGASGGVGLFAVQIAKILGADVTAVCSARSAQLVQAVGADTVIDYGTTDITRLKDSYDLFFDVHGGYTFRRVRNLLGETGRMVTIAPTPWLIGASALSQRFGKGRIRTFFVQSRSADLRQISKWFETGKMRVHIERCYALEDAAEAFRHLEGKHTQGKLVFTLPS